MTVTDQHEPDQEHAAPLPGDQQVGDAAGEVDRAEIDGVLHNLTWLDRCTCSSRPLSDFFVAAGHVPPVEAMAAARACPTRRQEVIFAYARELKWGYFGALSPGQRAKLTLRQALDLIESESAGAGTA